MTPITITIAGAPACTMIRRHRRPAQESAADRIPAQAAKEAGRATDGLAFTTGRPQPLRRWSVGELLARAAVAPAADGPARG